MIWAATKDGIIHLYDNSLQEKGILTEKGTIGKGRPLKGIAYCIMEDSRHNIWIGSKGEGVYRLTPGPEGNNFDILHIRHEPDNVNSLSDNQVYTIHEDREGNIWIGTFGGGINLIPGGKVGETVLHHSNGLGSYPYSIGDQVRIINSDRFGNICVGTTLGLIMFKPDLQRPDRIDYKVYVHRNGHGGTVGANDIMDICTTRTGETFVGTFGGESAGLPRLTAWDSRSPSKLSTAVTVSRPTSSSPCRRIATEISAASEGGLTKFNRTSGSFENYSEMKRLMKRNNFSENARCALRDGRILFGIRTVWFF